MIFLFGFLTDTVRQSVLSLIFGLSVISLTLFISFWTKELFFNTKLKKPKLKADIKEAINKPGEYNLADFLSFEAAKAVLKSINFAQKKKISEVSSTVLLYNILLNNPKLNFIFSRVLISLKELKTVLKTYLKSIPAGEETVGEIQFQKSFQDAVLDSLKIAQKKNHQRIEISDLITALTQNDLILKKTLIDNNLKVADFENLAWWLKYLEDRIASRKRFWEWKNLIKKGSIGKAWAAGYTLTLDKFGVDYSEIIKRQDFPEIIGHQKELEAIERILARTEINNCLLVGEPGVGRKSMISALAQKSVLGESLPEINYKRIVQLDLTSLATRTESIEEAEVVLDRVFQEVVSAGNIVLVIDEFHDYVSGKERPGIIDISGVLGSYLNLPQLQILAITTYAGLHKYIEQKPSVLSLFEKVEVSEVSERETLMILEKLALQLEAKYKKFIAFPALREIISLSKKYISTVPWPKSAMDLLDETMVYISSTKEKIVLPKHVNKIISEKTEIPIGNIEKKEKKVLLNLEKLIHQRIINQEEAVKEVSTALRRARAEVTVRKGPMGTFLFLGPTGVGKTETAKALTETYFSSEDKMIRLDMSEFQGTSDIARLIGSSSEEGLLTTQVRENPFSLILLDEIEKAHPNILNLFLQVLDEGHLTDGLGRKVDFKNSIIIATSNAGYQVILKAIKDRTEWSGIKQTLLDYLFEEGVFRPEFINRFDAVVVFKPLTKENLLGIAELLLQKLKENLKEKNIDFIITPALKEKIVELGYNPTFGAREMRRVIQDKVENVLASALLAEEVKRGDRVEINPETFEIKK